MPNGNCVSVSLIWVSDIVSLVDISAVLLNWHLGVFRSVWWTIKSLMKNWSFTDKDEYLASFCISLRLARRNSTNIAIKEVPLVYMSSEYDATKIYHRQSSKGSPSHNFLENFPLLSGISHIFTDLHISAR